MTHRTIAWIWIAAGTITLAIEAVIQLAWPRWYDLVRGAHWIAFLMAAYNFGRHAGQRTSRGTGRPGRHAGQKSSPET